MESRCSMCGQEKVCEYGTNGMPYCNACIFYGTNKRCSKCSMYLPEAEMQNYAGQLYCQYCLMDIRDEQKHQTEDRHEQMHVRKDTCENCGSTSAENFFSVGGRVLCTNCAKDYYDGAIARGEEPILPMRMGMKKSKKKGILKRIRDFLFGAKEEEDVEIIAVRNAGKEKAKKGHKDFEPLEDLQKRGVVAEVLNENKEENEESTQEKKEKIKRKPKNKKEQFDSFKD